MSDLLSSALTEKRWRTENEVCQNPPWGFLGKGEGHLLYYLARDYYRGAGVIVDAGAFVGRSAWFLATGLAENPHLERHQKLPIHCFDNFIVNDDITTAALQTQFGVRLPLGASTRGLFDTAVADVAEWLEVHEGDFQTYVWEPRPIEILFIDIAKSVPLNRRIVDLMFPCLLPGVSIVVQQDYHHPWLPHLHTTMEYLHDYFEIVEPKIDDSTAFLCTRAIPPDVAAEAATLHQRLEPAALLALMDRAIARLPPVNRAHVELARANLIGTAEGFQAMEAALAEIDGRYGTPAGDDMWPGYRRAMQDMLSSLRWDLRRAWRLVGAGRLAEGLAIAEEVSARAPNNVEAQVLRAHCLRLLRQTEAFGDQPEEASARVWRRLDSQSIDADLRGPIEEYLNILVASRSRIDRLNPGEMAVKTPGEAHRIKDARALHAALHAMDIFQFCYGSAAEHEALCRRLETIRGILTPEQIGGMLAALHDSPIERVYAFLTELSDDQFADALRGAVSL